MRTRLRPALALLLAVVLAAPQAGAASRPALRGPRGIVVSPERHATEVGVEVLRRGGNAVDAAVAVAVALAVTYPRAGNLAGGGFLLYREPGGKVHALDFREVAPRRLTAAMLLDATGKPDPGKTRGSGLAVAVPATVHGLADAQARWGTRPFAAVVRPAIPLAERGIPLSPGEAAVLQEEKDKLLRDPAASAVFAPAGTPLRAGERLVQPDLARTLRALSRQGPAALTSGPIAASIVESARARGGVLTLEDLAGYRPVLREPLVSTYRGLKVTTFPPPSAGGIAVLQVLAMLERFDLAASGPGASLTLHRLAEAERRAFADRAFWVGDPDYVPVPTAALLDPRYLASRAATIRDDAATPSSGVQPGKLDGDTLHLVTADREGGLVTLTTTLNSHYGAGIVAAGTGLLLNDEVDDFAVAPGIPNQFGLAGGAANAVAGGRRPVSSMCPTLVERPGAARPLLALGSPSGSRIVSAVVQTIVNVVDFGMELQEAVDAPRIHHQWLPDVLYHEPRGLPADVAAALRARGHTLQARTFTWFVEAVGTADDGTWIGAADARGEGTAGAP
ncbi:MAG TPA: gamma-glutamyltransferase [Candidatus Polarisedimenticolaceae bacterium]|nr:gamma-glutamyltransferase [Candidatus Polarisedimenticolaceae bacterium]